MEKNKKNLENSEVQSDANRDFSAEDIKSQEGNNAQENVVKQDDKKDTAIAGHPIDEKYAKFFEQYEKRKNKTIKESNVGKYDADLDFNLNRKIKKVRYPLPKAVKILICVLAACITIIPTTILTVKKIKETPHITLTKLDVSQPWKNNAYEVSNVYAGDKLNFDNIYLNCEYSDGTTKKVALTRSMLSTTSSNIDENDVFKTAGDVVFELKYSGITLNLKYVVQQKIVNRISLFMPKETIEVEEECTELDLSDKIVVNAELSSGEIQKIDITKCDISVNGTRPTIENGILDISSLTENGRVYSVAVSYQGKTAHFNIKKM